MSQVSLSHSRWLVLLPVLLACAIPVTFSRGRLVAATAECQDGTCCPERGSICVVGTHQIDDKYFKDAGSCSTDPKQPLPPP